jgi:hypothetical protein
MRSQGVRTAAALAAFAAVLGAAAPAQATLAFGTAPKLPTLPAVTINGKSQTINATMASFSVTTTETAGWNVTVQGQTGTGKSAVFAQYCAAAKCGTEAEGYKPSGFSLPADSLKLSTTGAKVAGGTGTTPSLECATACNVDSATAVKILSAPTTATGTWTASGFSTSSLQLAIPTTLRALAASQVYRVNILWTLSTGP